MIKENVNRKAIEDVYKNAHIALQSLSDLIPTVKDKEMKEELKEQYSGYETVINDVSEYMKKKKIEPKDIGPFKKAMMWSSIKMKTLIDSSKNQVAEMMINGTVMGINELYAMKNEKNNFNEDVSKYIEQLLHLEEGYEQRLKKFL